MIKYLILAVADISKPQDSVHSNANTPTSNRNITIDSDEQDSPSSSSATNHFNLKNSKNGSTKFILKQVYPIVSEELITAFEYEGKLDFDLKSVIGRILEVSEGDFCRNILLLKSSKCKILGPDNNVQSVTEVDIEDFFDADDLLDLSFM